MNKTDLYIMRRNKSITQKELAQHLNCSIPMISYLERGERNFTKENYEKYRNYIMNK